MGGQPFAERSDFAPRKGREHAVIASFVRAAGHQVIGERGSGGRSGNG